MKEVIREAMRGECYRALASTNGDVLLAARNLGYTKTAFYRLLQNLGIKLERKVTVRAMPAKPT